MSRPHVWLALSTLTLGLVVWGVWPSRAQSGVEDTAKVKLYSGGQQVGEWTAYGAGRVEGDTLVFRTRKGVRDLEVRVHGTWSFERQP